MSDSIVFVGMDAWANEALPNQVNAETRGLKVDSTTNEAKRSYLHFKLPFTPGDVVDVTEATLRFRPKGAIGGTRTFTAVRIAEAWSPRRLSWSNRPTLDLTVSASVVVSNAADGDIVEMDVTPLLAGVAAGTAEWHGFRLTVGTGGPFSIWSAQALTPSWRPRLEMTWTELPDPPTNLSPSGGNAVSKARPNLGWSVRGSHGETAQAKARVQLSPYPDMSSITWDSGLIDLVETEIDLSDGTYGAPAIADGDTVFWRVRYSDDAGRLSDWSNTVRFTRRAKGSVSLLNPVNGATLEDLTPTVIFDFTGATLDGVALYLEKVSDDGRTWEELWRFPRSHWTGASYWIAVPAGLIRRTTDQYRFRIRAWDDPGDDIDREARPGDPTWSQDIAAFTWDRNDVVDPVDSITVNQHPDGSPLVDVVITDDDAPAYYSLVVDGDRQYPRIDPVDVVTGAGEYTIVYDAAPPLQNLTYEVERVLTVAGELKHSKLNNPSDTYESTPTGIWLWDRDDPDYTVKLWGPEHGGDFDWGEVSATFNPVGRYPQAPVRLLQSTRGREGTVHGALRDTGGVKARTFLTRLRRVWRQGRRCRLVMGEMNIPVLIGEPHDSPMGPPGEETAYQVSFNVFQIDEFDR